MLRAGVLAILLLVGLAAALLIPAGRWDWPAAWAVLIAFTGFTVATWVLVDPALIRERARPGPGVERWDAVLATVSGIFLYPGTLIVCGLDAGRPEGPALPPAVEAVALAVFVAGYAFALWAMRVNRFFATYVRIQADRGHRVVTTGPYALVRHPGYAGAMLAHLALPLALGSLWGLVPALCGVAGFTVRTALEDRTLARELDGYAEYRRHVRWRLVPGVW